MIKDQKLLWKKERGKDISKYEIGNKKNETLSNHIINIWKMEKEDLKLRTKKFSLDIIYLYKSLPKTAEFQTIGRQLLKSGTSVGANTRSAYRGRSKKEFIAKLGVVIEEADESGFWLELLEELSINNKETLLKLRNEANELTAIFTSIVKNNK